MEHRDTERNECQEQPGPEEPRLSRRSVLRGAGGSLAIAALPGRVTNTRAQTPQPERRSDLTGRLARYMVEARDRPLRPSTELAARHRILDTFAAIVSGARLGPGEVTIEYVRGQGGTPEASVATTDIMTSAVNAALAKRDVRPCRRNRRLSPLHEGPSRLFSGPRQRWPWASAKRVREPNSSVRWCSATTCAAASWWRSIRPWSAPGDGAPKVTVRHSAPPPPRRPWRGSTKCRCATPFPTPFSSIRRVELGARSGTHREGLRLQWHGRPQRRGGGDHGAGRLHRRHRCPGGRAQCHRRPVD